MQYIEQLLFVIILGVALYFFVKKIKQIRRKLAKEPSSLGSGMAVSYHIATRPV